jgi:hypothetical protein
LIVDGELYLVVSLHGYIYVVRVGVGRVSSQAPHTGADPKLFRSLAEQPKLIMAAVNVHGNIYGPFSRNLLNYSKGIIEVNATTWNRLDV